jgi:hypothetical protein
VIPLADSFTAWLGAASTVMLGVLGLVVTVWQWRQTGFRPGFTCRIDEKRQAIELRVANRGRAAGKIQRVLVVRPAANETELHAVRVDHEGKSARNFGPWDLPPFASMRLILRAVKPAPFQEEDLVKVEWGADDELVMRPETALGVSLYTKSSALP